MNQIGTQRIETDRFILRRFTMDDADDMYFGWASDPEVTKYLTWPAHGNIEVTKQVLADWVRKYEYGRYFNWAIEWKETGKAIGNISVNTLKESVEAATIGYCLSRAYWGRSIMPEALRAVIGYLQDQVGLRRVAACHDRNNPKSGRVMAKAGMQKEGVFRMAGKNNQGICDNVWYSILPSDRNPNMDHQNAEKEH